MLHIGRKSLETDHEFDYWERIIPLSCSIFPHQHISLQHPEGILISDIEKKVFKSIYCVYCYFIHIYNILGKISRALKQFIKKVISYLEKFKKFFWHVQDARLDIWTYPYFGFTSGLGFLLLCMDQQNSYGLLQSNI